MLPAARPDVGAGLLKWSARLLRKQPVEKGLLDQRKEPLPCVALSVQLAASADAALTVDKVARPGRTDPWSAGLFWCLPDKRARQMDASMRRKSVLCRCNACNMPSSTGLRYCRSADSVNNSRSTPKFRRSSSAGLIKVRKSLWCSPSCGALWRSAGLAQRYRQFQRLAHPPRLRCSFTTTNKGLGVHYG